MRTVVLVTDTIDTGSQVHAFLSSLLRNRTLRSWHSFGWIQFVTVTYAMSKPATVRLSKALTPSGTRFVRAAPTIRDLPWKKTEICNALDLCTDFAKGKDRLGYGEHAGLFGFQERVPNTVPKIFWQKRKDWSPLFENRQAPPDIADAVTSVIGSRVTRSELLTAVQQQRLSVSIAKQQSVANRDVLSALSILLVSPGATHSLGVALGKSQAEIESLLTYLYSQGWTSPSHDVTAAGRAELRGGKRKRRRVETKVLPPDRSPYYPSTLR